MTFGLSEIVGVPSALLNAANESLEKHVFHVWYSPDGKYIYHQVRDIE